MQTTIHCVRCGQDRAPMAFRPFPTELGLRIFSQICGACWSEWLRTQQQLINHYGLNVRDTQAKEFLVANMNQFLFGARTS